MAALPPRAPRFAQPQPALSGVRKSQSVPCRPAASAPTASSSGAAVAALASRTTPRRSLRAAAAGGGGQEAAPELQEMPSEEERAEMDAAALALVEKLQAAYEQMEDDDEEEGPRIVDVGEFELEDGAGAGGLGPRRGRRRKPREKEVPIEFLPKASPAVSSPRGSSLKPSMRKP